MMTSIVKLGTQIHNINMRSSKSIITYLLKPEQGSRAVHLTVLAPIAARGWIRSFAEI